MVLLTGSTGCTSRALLHASLLRWGLTPPLPPLGKREGGMPYFPHRPDLHVSLSHSGDWVLCALSTGPVGVDIEGVRPRRDSLPRYALTPGEQGMWEAMGATWPAFYHLWTRKEAWCKLTGQGLAPLLRREVPEDGLIWAHYQGQGWAASLCAREEAPADILWLDVPPEEVPLWQD